MTTNIKYTIIIALAILIIGLGYFYTRKEPQSNTGGSATTTIELSPTGTGTTTNSTTGTDSTKSTTKTLTTVPKAVVNLISGNTTGFYSYNSSEYGFTIKFPSYVQMRNSFSTFHEIGNNWRLYAGPANQGKPVASFSVYSIDQGTYPTGKQSYPLYFTSEVRVGVSPNVKECYALDAGFANEKVTNVTINGVAFKKFSTSEAVTTKYTQAESYRTIHNNKCYVLEQIKSGTTYRDSTMTSGTAESTLTGYYNAGETIIKTFKFIN